MIKSYDEFVGEITGVNLPREGQREGPYVYVDGRWNTCDDAFGPSAGMPRDFDARVKH